MKSIASVADEFDAGNDRGGEPALGAERREARVDFLERQPELDREQRQVARARGVPGLDLVDRSLGNAHLAAEVGLAQPQFLPPPADLLSNLHTVAPVVHDANLRIG
jgi:hypothetical protein